MRPELELTVDQVPPNRALVVQPHSPGWEGLDSVYRWVLLCVSPRREGYACGYPDQVNGDSLESRFVIGAPSLRGTKLFDHAMVGCHAMVGVSGGHNPTHDMTCEACRVIR